jgi:hypothetical protein
MDGGTMPETARRFGRIVAYRTLLLLAATGACCCVSVATSSQASATSVWLGQRKIAPPGQVGEASVVVDGNGDIAAVWSGPDNGIETAVRPAGGLWQAPVTISRGVGEVRAPLVATSAPGQQAAVIWWREGTVNLSEGSLNPFLLHAPTMLSPGGLGFRRASLAMDPAGDSVSGWYRDEHREKVAEVDFRPAASGPWLGPLAPDPLAVSEKSPSDIGDAPVQVAIGAGGDAVAAWSRSTLTFPTATTIKETSIKEASYKPAGGTWQPPVPMPGLVTSSPIQLGVDAHGDAVAAWEAGTGRGGRALEASVRPAASGRWQPPQLIAESGPMSLEGFRTPRVGPNPALAVGEGGEAVLAWEAVRGNRRVVEVATGSASTGTWQPTVVLETWPDWPSTGVLPSAATGNFRSTPIAHPSVAIAADGEALVAWDNASSLFRGTVDVALRPAPGAPWQSPVAVANAAAEGVQVATNALGEAAIVWTRLAKNGGEEIESDVLARLGITGASLSHHRFRIHRRPSRFGAPFGTQLRFNLSAPAQVTVAVTVYRSGVPINGRCVTEPRRRLPDTLRPCTHPISLGSWHEARPAGPNTMKLTHRLGQLGLHAGTYRLTLSAASGADTASPVKLPFYIAQRRTRRGSGGRGHAPSPR